MMAIIGVDDLAEGKLQVFLGSIAQLTVKKQTFDSFLVLHVICCNVKLRLGISGRGYLGISRLSQPQMQDRFLSSCSPHYL